MISEEALGEVCRPAILGRAQIIARGQRGIWKREVSYVEKGAATYTVLSANVDSTTGYQDHYKTQITFDEADDVVIGYRCTCPAAARYAGPCKHSIALALDFNKCASLYEGYNELMHVSTSNVLSEYLDRSAPSVMRIATGAEEPPGSVRLGVTLVRERDLKLRLSVSGQHGSYVVRSISSFALRVIAGDWFEYGKKLAFTHRPDAFEPTSRKVALFLARCVQNRRAYVAERIAGYAYGAAGSAAAAAGRELRLSGPEADELVGFYMGGRLEVEAPDPGVRKIATARMVEVKEGDPDLALSIVPTGNGAYELVRESRISFFSTGARLYALDGSSLWRCTSKLDEASGFLTAVWDSTVPQILLGETDARRFAAGVLPALEKSVRLSVPRELDELRPAPAQLVFYFDHGKAGVTCDAVARYGDEDHHLLRHEVGSHLGATRDIEAEVRARRLVSMYFQMPPKGPASEAALAHIPEKADEAIARLLYGGLEEFSRRGEVRVTKAFERLVNTGIPQVRLGLSIRANLINLEVSTEDLPLDELYALLASYRRHQRFHRLRDGSFVDLSKANLQEASRLADELGLSARELACGTAQIPSYKAFLLDALMSDDEKDESFEDYIDNFRSVDPTSYKPPQGLAGTLRPYQVAGFQWLSALVEMGFGGILADEMGLGKSLQLISLLTSCRGRGKALIVCPASLVYNWQAEFEKFAPQMDVAVCAGGARERACIRREHHEVYITSYDLLRRDVESWAQISLAFEVLDEAQFIKNHETLAARAVKALDARYRFALTGTPIENRLSELWSIFDYLMPGLLGSYDRFRDRYEQQIIEGDEEVAARLRSAIGPFVLRRLKSEVLRDLPDKLEQVVYAHMEGEQRTLYAAHEQALRLSLANQSEAGFSQGKLQVLAELTRLRQICCDPHLLYDDYEGGSCKLDTVMQLVSSVIDAQEKMLVFSQFTSYLSLVAAELDREGVAYYTITGSTPKRKRVELVEQFNADDTPVFLISLKAGGTGLNLVGASVVIHADPWWNAAAQNQATDRAHRIGQTRDVTVYKVIARDTIEERILLLQEAKSDLADQVVGEGEGLSLASLRKEDLIELLGT